MLTRKIELYFGFGDDSGTWSTDYVDIPYDTPEEKIGEVASEIGRNGGGYVFVGVYAIPGLDDEINAFEDKKGNIIEIGDSVDCDATDDNLEFRGTLTGTHGNYLTVEDMEGNTFCLTPNNLELVE